MDAFLRSIQPCLPRQNQCVEDRLEAGVEWRGDRICHRADGDGGHQAIYKAVRENDHENEHDLTSFGVQSVSLLQTREHHPTKHPNCALEDLASASLHFARPPGQILAALRTLPLRFHDHIQPGACILTTASCFRIHAIVALGHAFSSGFRHRRSLQYLYPTRASSNSCSWKVSAQAAPMSAQPIARWNSSFGQQRLIQWEGAWSRTLELELLEY
mmetsp:Transcript_12019/g.24809  ORF Transcript_12019/g.24809 Transcript_12019/m.24809 type:complete len:215 (+) Transcript_12019:1690-2334(+)